MTKKPETITGYRGHKVGSRKGTIHQLFDEQGSDTAWTRGLKMKLKETISAPAARREVMDMIHRIFHLICEGVLRRRSRRVLGVGWPRVDCAESQTNKKQTNNRSNQTNKISLCT